MQQSNNTAALQGLAVNAIRRFEDLEVWQVAREIAKGVYRACKSQRLGTDPALRNQMTPCAVSISSNIAEGFERGTRKQNIEFCYTAKGSAGELRSQLIVAREAGLLDDVAYDWLFARCEDCSRLLHGYIRSLKQTKAQFPGMKYQE